MPGKARFTRADYERTPEDWRGELVEGDLVMIPAPDASHQGLVLDLATALDRHLGAQGHDRILPSPVDVVIDDSTVLQPDVLVLPEGTRRQPHPWRIPTPVWVAEILSPSTAERDRGVKMTLYARAGVREAWILDPDASSIEVRDLATGHARTFRKGATAESRVLAGFRLDVTRFFAT